jgi:hypothetical protein
MAKFARTAAAPRTSVIVVPAAKSRGKISRRRRVAGALVRRGARRARRAVREGAVPLGTLLGAAGLGYAQAKGYLNKIPTIGGSRALTIAIAGYAVTRLTTNPTARSVGKTAMLIGAFDWGSKQGGGKSNLEGDDLEGDDFGDDIEGDFE